MLLDHRPAPSVAAVVTRCIRPATGTTSTPPGTSWSTSSVGQRGRLRRHEHPVEGRLVRGPELPGVAARTPGPRHTGGGDVGRAELDELGHPLHAEHRPGRAGEVGEQGGRPARARCPTSSTRSPGSHVEQLEHVAHRPRLAVGLPVADGQRPVATGPTAVTGVEEPLAGHGEHRPVDRGGAGHPSSMRGRATARFRPPAGPRLPLTHHDHSPGTSVFPLLEPLLEQVSKPIQYVGGELNSTVKDWNCGGHGPGGEELTTRWALMYPDAYEVGVPNQGVMILYEVLNERPDALAERTYAVWPDLEALMREHRVPQFTVDAHRVGPRLRRAGPVVLDRARLHQHAHRPRPRRHPAARGRPHRRRPARRGGWPRRLQPRAGRRLPRRRDRRRRRGGGARGHRPHPATWKAAGSRVAGASCCCGWPAPAGSTSRRSTT